MLNLFQHLTTNNPFLISSIKVPEYRGLFIYFYPQPKRYVIC